MRLSIALALCSVFVITNARQWSWQSIFSSTTGSKGPVITPEFFQFVKGIVDSSNIRGLSLAIVRKNEEPEYGTWGIRTEEGDAMSSIVRPALSSSRTFSNDY